MRRRLTAGQTTQANASTKDANGNVLTGRTIVWTTSDPAVASVDGVGTISALKAGTATVTATSEGKTGTARSPSRRRQRAGSRREHDPHRRRRRSMSVSRCRPP